MFGEENDYIFLKKIEVLHVDSDLLFQKEISENIGGYITITSCISLDLAIERIESKNYDLILCDMSFPSESLKDFFNRYSKKIPIVATSASKDPKIAYSAARMGARDYIHKTIEDFKKISKTLHNVHLVWIKDKEQKDSLQLLNDPNIRIVLRDLINTDLPIYQTISVSVLNKMQINDTIKNTYNIQANDILLKYPHILKTLSDLDYLKKESVEQTLACPNCKSVNIFAHYSCDKCKSSKFEVIYLPVHNACGKVSTRDKTKSENKLLCTYCCLYYENISANYHNTKGFQCFVCDNTFTNPSMVYSCKNCNLERFAINQGSWVELFKYKLQQKNLNKIKKSFFLLIQLEELLRAEGFIIDQYEKIQIGGNTFGPFELIAYKDNLIFIFIIINTDLQYNIRRIFEIDIGSKSEEKNIRSFAIAFYEPQDIILKLLDKFGIMPLIELDANEIVKKIKRYL
jgi:CheY-like chemotaxis protein